MKVLKLNLGILQSNVYIVYDEKSRDAFLIDCASNGQKIVDYLRENHLYLKYIILTHGHIDHIEGTSLVAQKTNAKVIIHKGDKEFLTNDEYNLSKRFFIKFNKYQGDIIFIDEDKELSLCSYIFKFIHTPGHTPGSMCVIVDDFMFTGDTLFLNSIGNDLPPFGNIKQEILSIKHKLLTLNSDYICYPGHGEKTSLFYEKNNNEYLI